MKMKKWVALVTGAIMASSLLSACSGNSDESATKDSKASQPVAQSNVTETGLPIVKEPITIKMFAGKRLTSQNLNDIMLWNEYKKMTNINVAWDDVNRDQLMEKRNTVLASGDYPDAFYGSRFSSTELLKYGQQGVFIKLNDMLDKYAPNLKRYLDQNPEIRRAMTLPDGNIYGLPTLFDPSFKAVQVGTFMWFQKQWLDKLSVTAPATTDELYSFLKKVKETDPNVIPIGGDGAATLVRLIEGSWGLGNRGQANMHVDVDPKTQAMRFIPSAPEYKEMLQYINKLYAEGLLERDTFSANADQFIANGMQGKYAVHMGYNPETVFKQTGYVTGPTLKGPKGDQTYANIGSIIAGLGNFVITKNNKNPEATLRWMDYLYSDEGAKMFFMGFENVTYKKTADGQYEYVDDIKNNPKGLTQDQAVGQYLTWPGGGYPGIVKQQFFKGAEGLPSSIDAANKIAAQFPKEIWPSFTFTVEEADRMAALKTDIETYVKEMLAKFITGNVPFADWDKYTATLQKMGLDEYMKIYKAAYDRYSKK